MATRELRHLLLLISILVLFMVSPFVVTLHHGLLVLNIVGATIMNRFISPCSSHVSLGCTSSTQAVYARVKRIEGGLTVKICEVGNHRFHKFLAHFSTK